MRSSTVRPRGFTLIELLVGAAVGSVVLLGISLAFISQARQYQAHASRRAIQASARQAMTFLERTLGRAGYGVDPDRAIVPYDAFNSAGSTATSTPGFPDAIAVHSRDPLFRRLVRRVQTNQLELTTALNEELLRGQILLILCPGAATYAYATVGTPAKVGDTIIQLDHTLPASDTPMGGPGALFRDNERLLNPVAGCFSGNEPSTLVKVDRAAFYVASFPDPTTSTPRPYLMLHRGLDIAGGMDGKPDNTIDAKDAVPLADGIEQFQVAYILNTINAAAGASNRTVPTLVGVVDSNIPNATGGTRTWPFGEQWALTAPLLERPSLADPYDSPRRVTAHPANIRQVRLTLVARSSAPDPQLPGDDARVPGAPWSTGSYGGVTTWNQLENLGPTPNSQYDPRGGGFYRVVLRQAITPKNLLIRSQFLPVTLGGG
jgi:type IV pilus assembly protein PilW